MTETISSRCATSRGRKIPRETVVRLIAAGAGWCYKPDCSTGSLWYVVDEQTTVKLAEVAHMIAAGGEGPRADPEATEDQLTHFNNLLLLCPNCHTIVDRAPETFTLHVIQEWKTAHETRLRQFLGITRYKHRVDLNHAVSVLLTENRSYWQHYGPESEGAERITSNRVAGWRRNVVEEIIPNNLKIRRIIHENMHLLSKEEQLVVSAFNIHAQGLMDRHLLGLVSDAPRFPKKMNDIFDH